jgi:hypothetical protein
MLIVKCDTCGDASETLITPAGVPIMPKGWKQCIATVKNVASPRPASYECGKLECRLIGHSPPEAPKEETWGMSEKL